MDKIDHDHQLRVLLKAHLGTRVGTDDLVIDEFLLAYGAVRADVTLINGRLEGFEIKAGRDSLNRLAHQLEAYGRVFDYSWVVTTPAHLRGVRALVSRECGLLVASVGANGVQLKQLRKAQINKRRDPDHLVRLLWRDEVLAKLDALNLGKGLKSRPKPVLYAALAQALPMTELAEYVRFCLKSRAGWRVGEAPHAGGDLSRRAAS